LTDKFTRLINTSSEPEYVDNLRTGSDDVQQIHARCAGVYPDFDVSIEEFTAAIIRAVDKYLVHLAKPDQLPDVSEIRKFISELQCGDLYLTLGCARGNEQAWRRFDGDYRSLIERLARQLVGRGMDANEVIDSVYVELYGMEATDGVRQSKFRTYTGRGTLRGWLRSVISHSAVDLYRGRRDEVSLEDWSNKGNDVPDGLGLRPGAQGGESSMLDNLLRERYRSATIAALDKSLSTLDAHETLLLLYYHVEGLKLREIAHIVEAPTSSIRGWFQRRKRQSSNPTRIHESTVMRWLENVYKKVSDRFRSELKNQYRLNPAEIDICLDIVTEDFGPGVGLNLDKPENRNLVKQVDEDCRVEGAS
jgi:RNA polymerase sigma factor, sigma-70 family